MSGSSIQLTLPGLCGVGTTFFLSEMGSVKEVLDF